MCSPYELVLARLLTVGLCTGMQDHYRRSRMMEQQKQQQMDTRRRNFAMAEMRGGVPGGVPVAPPPVPLLPGPEAPRRSDSALAAVRVCALCWLSCVAFSFTTVMSVCFLCDRWPSSGRLLCSAYLLTSTSVTHHCVHVYCPSILLLFVLLFIIIT